jgi:hypothetical protein
MGLNASLLEDEREAEQRFPTILPDAWTEIELGMLPTVEHDSSELFSTAGGSSAAISGQQSKQQQQRRLVPSRKDRGNHIPDWMPEFPPDHTFMTTSSLPDRVTDPRALREMIVQEGQLAEHALRRLTGVIRVDENAATHDEDDEPAIPDETTATAPTAKTSGDHSSDESKGFGAALPKGLKRSGTAEPVSLSAAARDEDRASATTASTDSTTMSGATPNGTSANGTSTADMATTPVPTANSAEDDPFNIKHYQPASKRFDVVGYANAKRRKLQKPSATFAATVGANGGANTITTKNNTSTLLRDNSPAAVHARSERFHWQRSLTTTSKTSSSTTNTTIDADTLEIIDHEDRDPAGLGAAISLVEHEYNVALAKIQRSKDAEAKKESIVDTGIVNWERDRFLWA